MISTIPLDVLKETLNALVNNESANFTCNNFINETALNYYVRIQIFRSGTNISNNTIKFKITVEGQNVTNVDFVKIYGR